MRRSWNVLASIVASVIMASLQAFGQNGDTIEVNWNSAVLTILITAIMVAGIILYEWVRLKKTE